MNIDDFDDFEEINEEDLVRDEQELISMIKSFENESELYSDSETIHTALDHYLGAANGRERDGYSKVVTREVLETIETIVPYLMKLFFSGDEVVRFEPENEDDIARAQQETDYVNWVFLRKNKGFNIGETAIRDALINRVGICKVYHEETVSKKRVTYHNKSLEELMLITQDTEVEIVETSPTEDGTGNLDVVILQSNTKGGSKIEAVPPEEFRINRAAKDIETCNYCAHVTTMNRSQIEELGFEIDDNLAGNDTTPFDVVATRGINQVRQFSNGTFATGEAHDDTLKEFKISESYIRTDWDGDGYAELRQVIHVGNQVLSNEEVDDIPFVAWSPLMLAHRFEGMSIVDLAKDLQLIKTTITRNMLDNQYLANNGRYTVMDGQVNLDDLLNSKPGGYVRVQAPGALQPLPTPQLSGEAFSMLQLIDKDIERRTGVSDRMRGFDPNLLSANQPASSVSQVLSAVEQRMEMIARRFGEDFLVQVFRKIHSQSIKHDSGERKFRLNDSFEAVNPSEWDERYDMRVVVGLGNGNKTERLFHLQQLFAGQQAIIQGGGLGTLVTPKNIFALQEDIVQIVDKTARSRYFADPGDIKGNEDTGPSPAEQLALQEQQRKDLETEASIKIDQEKIKVEREELELKREELDFLRDKLEIDATLKKEELILEATLEAQQNRGVSLGDS